MVYILGGLALIGMTSILVDMIINRNDTIDDDGFTDY